MGIYSADKCYTGHPDFPMVCVGYDYELCCDCCGAECDEDELFDVDGEMYCEDCLVDSLDSYDIKNSPVYDDDGDLVDYCVYCGSKDEDLYMVENDICCGHCACTEYYKKITDNDIDAALECYFDRY